MAPLHVAAEKGDIKVVKALLSESADVNALDKAHYTPLHLAVLQDRLNVVKTLVEYGADVNVQSTVGNTPLHLAAENEQFKVVKALLNGNVDFRIENDEGKTALKLANESGNCVIRDYIRQCELLSRRLGTCGVSHLYEISLSMMCLLQGLGQKRNYYLATNVTDAGDLGNTIFKYEFMSEGRIATQYNVFFIQAIQRDEKDEITLEDLFSDSDNGDFNLKKYFNSYRKIKKRFSGEKDKIFNGYFLNMHYTIYTNVSLSFGKNNENENNFKKVDLHSESLLHFSEKGQHYQLATSGEKNKKNISVLYDSSNCKKLAKRLIKSMFSEEGLKVDEGILKVYHIPLAKEVIERVEGRREGKLKETFLNNPSVFGQAFLEEISKRDEFVNKSKDEVKLELLNKRISLSDNFGNISIKKGKYPEILPDDVVHEYEIKEFLNFFRLCVNQPCEKEICEILRQKLLKQYQVEPRDIDTVFSEVKSQVLEWWKKGIDYLTGDNTIFKDSMRISINYEIKNSLKIFNGRKKQLEELHGLMQEEGKVALTGPSGIGKTELVRKYIEDYSNEYNDNIIWINAENDVTISESFYWFFKDRLRLSTKDENDNQKSVQSIISEVYAFFAARNRKSLFIFDNAEKEEDGEDGDIGIFKFLPSTDDNVCFIITSCYQGWGEVKLFELNVFTVEEAQDVIHNEMTVLELENIEADFLAKQVLYLPLGVRHAAAYLRVENESREKWGEEHITIYKYFDMLKNKTEEMFGKGVDYSKDPVTAVSAVVKITTEMVRETVCGKKALDMFDRMAYLAPSNIPILETFCFVIEDEVKLNRAVEMLMRPDIVYPDDGMLNIHRMIQLVTRNKLEKQGNSINTVKKTYDLLRVSLLQSKDTLEYLLRLKELLPHSEKFLLHLKQFVGKNHENIKIEEEHLEDFLLQMSVVYHTLDHPRRQKELLERALEIQKKRYSPDHFEVAATELLLGNAYGALGDHQKQKLLLQKALDVQGKHYGVDNFQITTTLLSLGNAYGYLNDPENKKELLEKALKLQERHYGSDNLEIMKTLIDLGNAYSALNHLKKQIESVERALKIQEVEFHSNHFEIAESLVSLGNAYNALGDSQKVKKLLERALDIQETYYGPDHSEVMKTLESLGKTYGDLGDTPKQKISLKRALEIRQILERTG